jgi:hypothetical protein
MTLLSADAYFNRKVKVGNNAEQLHFCTCVWFGGWFGTLETSTKALILSISPKYSILDSLAYNYRMRVFALMVNSIDLPNTT